MRGVQGNPEEARCAHGASVYIVVGSSYPGGGEAPKGMAVRHLKRYVSWVQTVVRQVGLNLLQALILEEIRA